MCRYMQLSTTNRQALFSSCWTGMQWVFSGWCLNISTITSFFQLWIGWERDYLTRVFKDFIASKSLLGSQSLWRVYRLVFGFHCIIRFLRVYWRWRFHLNHNIPSTQVGLYVQLLRGYDYQDVSGIKLISIELIWVSDYQKIFRELGLSQYRTNSSFRVSEYLIDLGPFVCKNT